MMGDEWPEQAKRQSDLDAVPCEVCGNPDGCNNMGLCSGCNNSAST